jgi:hypothetical protein
MAAFVKIRTESDPPLKSLESFLWPMFPTGADRILRAPLHPLSIFPQAKKRDLKITGYF